MLISSPPSPLTPKPCSYSNPFPVLPPGEDEDRLRRQDRDDPSSALALSRRLVLLSVLSDTVDRDDGLL